MSYRLPALVLGVAAASAAAVVVVVRAEQSPTTQPVATTQPTAAVNKFCAVQQKDPVDPKVATTVYQGKTIGFCCPDCIDEFKKDPEKYMKTLK